jgi:opacity protein-like surface antigen
MKIIAKLIFFSVILIGFSYSQISIAVGPVLGYTGPTSDYSGTPLEYYNGTNYGLSGGVHFGVMARFKVLFIGGKASVMYASLSNSGNTGSGNQTTEVKHNLVNIAIGPEFIFGIPFTPLSPYAGIDLLFTSISGETTFQGMPDVPTGTHSMESASRTGLGLGFGLIVALGKTFSLDASFKYNMHNLLGKSFSGGENRIDSYTSLNDDPDPLYAANDDKHFIANSRSISTTQINLGFLFNF